MSASGPGGGTATDLAALSRATPDSAGELERLTSLLDQAFLQAIGWDAAAQTFAPPPEHPQLGCPVCLVVGCGVRSYYNNKLCHACRARYRSSSLDLATFITIQRVRVRARSSSTLLCAVAGCGRPVVTAPRQLCLAHDDLRHRLGLPLVAFIGHPQVRPMPSLGQCRVTACTGPAYSSRGLCRVHDNRWRTHRRNDSHLDLDRWCQTQPPPRNDPDRVVLLGLPQLLQAQLLYGLQERCQSGSKTKQESIRSLCTLLRHSQVRSIFELSVPAPRRTAPPRRHRGEPYFLAAAVQTAVRRALSSSELERRKDIWDMTLFGHRGTLDFTKITQPWLRQAAMHWATEEAPKRRGHAAANSVRIYIRSVEMLSMSLRLHRDDQGMNPSLLGRADVVAFLNRMAHLETLQGKEKISAYQRCKMIRQTVKLLRDFRELGLTRPGRALAGLPDDFSLRHGDVPQEPDEPEQGRALPPVVLEQLIAALPQLEEAYGREVNVAVQLLIDTGRRPDEICKLPWDCLEQDPDGKHTLVYTDFKNSRIGRRLAIADATARLITTQRQSVRACFPDTPPGELALLPRTNRNPHGTHSMSQRTLGGIHRKWVRALPMLRSGAGAEDGTEIPFDKAKVILYAYRHAFAQRHADAGTPVDVLCKLMGHDSMATEDLGVPQALPRRSSS
jgi:integrase